MPFTQIATDGGGLFHSDAGEVEGEVEGKGWGGGGVERFSIFN